MTCWLTLFNWRVEESFCCLAVVEKRCLAGVLAIEMTGIGWASNALRERTVLSNVEAKKRLSEPFVPRISETTLWSSWSLKVATILQG